MAGGQQVPEQHGYGFRAGQHGLRLDASVELLVQALDGVGGAGGFPLRWIEELSLKVGDEGIGWHIKVLLTRRRSRREKDCHATKDTIVAFRAPEGFSPDPLTDLLRQGARQLGIILRDLQ